jgi:hypothetical protein
MALPMCQLNDTVLTIIEAPRSLTRSGRLASPTNVLTFLKMEVSGDAVRQLTPSRYKPLSTLHQRRRHSSPSS